MTNEPRILHAVIAAAAGIVWQGLTPNLPPPWNQTILFAIILYAAAGAYAINWTIAVLVDHVTNLRTAMAVTPDARLAEALHNLTPNQTEIVMRQGVRIKVHGLSAGPEYRLDCGLDINPPMSFVAKMLMDSLKTYPHLPPIRSYPEGSYQRKYAAAAQRYFIRQGWAASGNGNKSAQMIVKLDHIMRALGLDDLIEDTHESN